LQQKVVLGFGQDDFLVQKINIITWFSAGFTRSIV